MRENQDMRQAALSKSLSAALLNHQISELEARVQSADLGTNGSPKHGAVHLANVEQRARAPGDTVAAAALEGAVDIAKKPGARHEALKVGRIDDEPADERVAVMTHAEDFDFSDIAEEDDEAWRVIVLDASVLIWALRSVRRIVGKGWEVIVPLETITTLDLLKKGSSHRATGARAATRYIEHAARQHKPLSHDPSIAVQSSTRYRRGRGLRLQRENESVPLSGLTELPVPLEDVPRWAASILGCAGYFARINAAESGEHGFSAGLERATLYVANLPLDVEILDEERDKYADRGEGHEIISEAGRFELSVEVVRDEELEDIAFGEDGRVSGRGRGRGRNAAGTGAGGERGRGRGRGRGGLNGSGGREKEEPIQEVKILLRRPQAVQTGSIGSGGEEHDHGLESGGEYGHTRTHTQKSAHSPGTAISNLPPAPQIKAPVLMKRDATSSGAETSFKLLSKDDAKVPSPAPPSAGPRAQRRETEYEREGRSHPANHETHFVLLKRPETKGDGRERGVNGGASGNGHRRREEGTTERERTLSGRGKSRGRGGKAGQGRRRRGSMSTDASSSAMSSDHPGSGGHRGMPQRERHDHASGDAGHKGRKARQRDVTDNSAKQPVAAAAPAVKLLQRALAGSSEKEKGPIISAVPEPAVPPPASASPVTTAPAAPPAPTAPTAQLSHAAQAFLPPSFLSSKDAATWQPPPEFKPRDFHPLPAAGTPQQANAPIFSRPPPSPPSPPFGHHAPPRPGPHAFGRPPRPPPAPFGHQGRGLGHGHGPRPHAFRPHGHTSAAIPGSGQHAAPNQPRSASAYTGTKNGHSPNPVHVPTQPRNPRQHDVQSGSKEDSVSIAPGWYESGFGGHSRAHDNNTPSSAISHTVVRSTSGPGHARSTRQAHGGSDKRERTKTADIVEGQKKEPLKPKVKRQPGSGPAGRGAFKAPVGTYRDDDEGAG